MVSGWQSRSDHPSTELCEKRIWIFCFNRIDKKLRMPDEHLHFLTESHIEEYSTSFNEVRCSGNARPGEVKTLAFNDPIKRAGKYQDNPPSPEEYRQFSARIVNLHPMTIIQNARTSGGGVVSNVPSQAISVGSVET